MMSESYFPLMRGGGEGREREESKCGKMFSVNLGEAHI